MTDEPCRRGPKQDDGFTLTEVLVALVILSVAIVTIVGVMTNMVIGSETQRGQAEADAGIRAYVEAIDNQLVTIPSANIAGSNCPAQSDFVTTSFVQPPSAGAPYPDLTFTILNTAPYQIQYYLPNSDRSTGYTITTSQAQCKTAYATACPNGETLSACSPGLYGLWVQVDTSKNSPSSRSSIATEYVLVRRANQ